MRWIASSALCTLMISSSAAARACQVEVVSQDKINGTVAKNMCPYPVNVSWCFGDGCKVDPGGTLLGPGYNLKISNRSEGDVYFYHCQAPQKVERKGSGYGCR